MGKKSKRRTGTRSKKKETREVNPSDEEGKIVCKTYHTYVLHLHCNDPANYIRNSSHQRERRM